MPFVTLTAGPPVRDGLAVHVRDRQRGSPSTSESLPKTLTVTESSSATVKLSFDATGASLTGVTVPDRRHGRDRPVGDRIRERRRTVVVRRRREHQLATNQRHRAIRDGDRRTTIRDRLCRSRA